jgi:hypothetical protein
MVTVRNVGERALTLLRAHLLPGTVTTSWLEAINAPAWDIAAVSVCCSCVCAARVCGAELPCAARTTCLRCCTRATLA